MEPFLGEIKLVPYNFEPKGWAFCNGQLLSIAQNTALFALLGTFYGGDGKVTFGLPDLRGRAALHSGEGPGLSLYSQGETDGFEAISLLETEMPSHNHRVRVSALGADSSNPVGSYPAFASPGLTSPYANTADSLNKNDVGFAGQSSPHENRQPYLVLAYVIALQGIFPSRP